MNFTSGSIKDLTKYEYLRIAEVWLYQNQKIKFYHLQGDRYSKTTESVFLPGIEPEMLTKYVNRGLAESPLDIERDWLKEFN